MRDRRADAASRRRPPTTVQNVVLNRAPAPSSSVVVASAALLSVCRHRFHHSSLSRILWSLSAAFTQVLSSFPKQHYRYPDNTVPIKPPSRPSQIPSHIATLVSATRFLPKFTTVCSIFSSNTLCWVDQCARWLWLQMAAADAALRTRYGKNISGPPSSSPSRGSLHPTLHGFFAD
jgi:hypothetical protein